MPPDNNPVLVDAVQDAATGVSGAAVSGAQGVGGAFSSGAANISASFGDIELMAKAVDSHTTYVQSQVWVVGRVSADADLLASMPLSAGTGAIAVAAVLGAAGQLQAHVVVSSGLAIVSATIVTTYQLADSTLSVAAAALAATVGVTGEVVVGAFNIAIAQGRTVVSTAVAGVTLVVVFGAAVTVLTAAALAESAESLVQAIQQTIDVYAANPELFLAGVAPMVVMTAAFAAGNYSVNDVWGNTTSIFQTGLGMTGPFYDDIVEGLIFNGQTFGLFNDGTATLGESGLSAEELGDRAEKAREASSLLIYGGDSSQLQPPDQKAIVPNDVASLFAGASQIDNVGLDAEAVIRVIKSIDANGNASFVVQIPSTMSWNPLAGATPNDVTSDLYAMARGDQTALAQAVYQAMERAGIRDEPVMLAGFSLGGITAGAIAAGDSGYNITQVVTAGSPIGRMGIPSDVNVISLEARQDLVHGLDGLSNPSSWTTIHEDAHLLGAEGAGSVINPKDAHDANRYAVMALAHPDINSDPGVAAFLNGGGTSEVVDYYATRK